MNYEKSIVLYDGSGCVLRSPDADDALEIIHHLRITSDETGFMARYGDEITMTPEDETNYLRSVKENPRALMIAAFVDGVLAANSGFNPAAPMEKYRLRAEFGISVKRAFWGRGVGSALLEANIEAARSAGYGQLELEVVTDNVRGIALYEKFGFQIYGTRPKSFAYRDGTYAAEHMMMLEL